MITTEEQDGVGLIVLDRHGKRNALDVEHLDALRAAVEKLAGTARAIVVTGSGTSFCAGADLHGVYGDGFRKALYAALSAITAAPVPVIAAVNGPAIGAGTQLAIACDLRVADGTAVFAVPTARNGLAVDPWTVRRLALLAGGGPARALLLGADRLDAGRAHACGLADRLGPVADALAWAREIAEFAPLSLRYAKTALESLFEPQPGEPRLDELFESCWSSEDFAESRRAHAEKRAPRFRGR
ncbi:enoyl-CoA hydratase [Amycolatopsis mongoliensis]|uniref:Enoyl-CoA hydratase n=1 Tax=Amycolatopsis mongoliensis TaxID=715475 RepID=A0A9Y2JPV4_9PSEU|nr:enoyl-CoA hydratase [Amycolatopsis sp. 4-36]WIY01212.1 enoyl-CoA hydratase [Amycolatopsis sp. 4-36]